MEEAYNIIANDFSKTRAYVWNCTKFFINNCEKDKTIIEIGCGNGRNLDYALHVGFNKQNIYAFDACEEFIEIVKKKNYNSTVGLIQNINNIYLDKKYDYLLCVAVIHHLKSEDVRFNAIVDCYNLIEYGGSGIFTSWSHETSLTSHDGEKLYSKKPRTFNKGDNIVGWNINGKKKSSPIAERYYYIYTEDKWFELWQKFKKLFPFAKINILWEEQNWITIVQKFNSI
jgi:SAM-dependent methyltransferase